MNPRAPSRRGAARRAHRRLASRSAARPKSGLLRRVGLIALYGAIGFIIGSIVLVALYRVLPPAGTPLMMIRLVEGYVISLKDLIAVNLYGCFARPARLVVVGVNLAVALCSTDTLAGTLLSSVPQVVSSRRGLMIEGVATLRGEGIRYRAVLLPLSENGATIDHVLGAMNYRLLRTNEALSTQVNFRRLPVPRNAGTFDGVGSRSGRPSAMGFYGLLQLRQ
jgi:hypothetical protein